MFWPAFEHATSLSFNSVLSHSPPSSPGAVARAKKTKKQGARGLMGRERIAKRRRLAFSLQQSHNSRGTVLSDPTTQWAPCSKRERRLETRQPTSLLVFTSSPQNFCLCRIEVESSLNWSKLLPDFHSTFPLFSKISARVKTI